MSLFNSANGLTRRKRIGEGDDGEPDVDDEPDHDNERDYRLAPKTLPRAKEVDGIVWVGERPAS